MSLACHKKSYLICVEFSKYYVIFIYFQAAVPALLAVSVLIVEKNQNKYYIIFRKFDTYQIAFLMTCPRHKNGKWILLQSQYCKLRITHCTLQISFRKLAKEI